MRAKDYESGLILDSFMYRAFMKILDDVGIGSCV